MQPIAILTAFLLAFATAAPTHIPTSQVTLHITTPTNAYHASTADTQHMLHASSATIQILVGQALCFDHAPLSIQGISIAGITQGRDLTTPARTVARDDWRVVCKARIGYGSMGWVFGVEDGEVKGEKGQAVDVTGLECWLEGDEGLVV